MKQLTPYQELKDLGNVPITTGVLQSLYADYQSPNMRISMLEQKGILVRLKRGVYVVAPEISGKPLSLGLIANHLYGPSYVSLHWALSWYGLIPESVFTVTSVTSRHTRMFDTPLGRYTYRGVSPAYFPIGIRSVEDNGIAYLMASAEKALCDMLMVEPYIPNQSLVRLEQFFEEDMRFDTDVFRDMDRSIIRECMEAGNKKGILKNLLKLMDR